MPPPVFWPGDRVLIRSLGEVKRVKSFHVHKGAEYGYTLVDDEGVEDEGWVQDDLDRVK